MSITLLNDTLNIWHLGDALFAVDKIDGYGWIFFGKVGSQMLGAIYGTMLTACAAE